MVGLRNSSDSGYTLIEVMMVMAISASLVIGVFAAQRSMVSQSQFDAAVNMVVSSVGAARSEAISGVNSSGSSGTGIAACAGGPPAHNTYPYEQWVFAGTEWVAQTGSVNVRHWEAFKTSQTTVPPGTLSCRFSPDTVVSLPVPLTVTAPGTGGRVLFVRDDNGSMHACGVADTTTDVSAQFRASTCAGLPMMLTVTDSAGHRAQVYVDVNGLARRQ